MPISFAESIDLVKNELQNATVQNLASAPSSPVEGQIYYNTTDDNLYVYTAAGWVDLTAQGATYSAGDGLDLSGTTFSLDLKSGSGLVITSTELDIDTNVIATKASVDLKAPLASPALTGNPTAPTPTAGDNDTSIATTAFVQNAVGTMAAGLDFKGSVRAATTANITISTALNNGDVLDGVTLATNDRVLVKDQSSAAENGIWVVGASPSRATDADAAGELSGGTYVFVEEGTTNADTGWVITTNGSITPGTTAHSWAIFSRAGELVAGDGLTKTGATLAVDSTVARRNAQNDFTVKQKTTTSLSGTNYGIEAENTGTGGALKGGSTAGVGVEATGGTYGVRSVSSGIGVYGGGQSGGVGVEGYSDTGPAFKVNGSHGTGAAFDANGEGKIIGVVDPTADQDAATKGYVDARTDDKGYAANIGNGSDTSIVVTHSLGTRDVVVEVYRNSGNYDTVFCEVRRNSTSQVTLVFATAPTSNQYRVVVRAI